MYLESAGGKVKRRVSWRQLSLSLSCLRVRQHCTSHISFASFADVIYLKRKYLRASKTYSVSTPNFIVFASLWIYNILRWAMYLTPLRDFRAINIAVHSQKLAQYVPSTLGIIKALIISQATLTVPWVEIA